MKLCCLFLRFCHSTVYSLSLSLIYFFRLIFFKTLALIILIFSISIFIYLITVKDFIWSIQRNVQEKLSISKCINTNTVISQVFYLCGSDFSTVSHRSVKALSQFPQESGAYDKRNGPFLSCCEPYYESEAKCKAFHMKITFVCI